MAEFVIRNTRVLVDGYDLSGKMNEVSLTANVDLVDATVFGSSARKRKPGLKSIELRGTAFFDSTAVDKRIYDRLGSTNSVISVVAHGTSAVNNEGNVAFSGLFLESEYTPGGSIGEMMMGNFAAMGDGQLIRGKLVAFSSKYTSSGDGTIFRLFPSSSGKAAYLAGHIMGRSSAGHEITLHLERASSSAFGGGLTTALTKSLTTTLVGTGIWETTVSGKSTDRWYRVITTVGAGTSGGGYKLVLTAGIK